MKEKISGAEAHIFIDGFDPEKIITYTGTPKLTEPGQWYFIFKKGETSNFPYDGSIIRAPSAANAQQIALVQGDEIYPVDMNRVCKTSADVSWEEGTIDTSDDCDPGSNILDGIVQVSGNISKLFRFNNITQEFDNITDILMSRFVDTVMDDGSGVYDVSVRDNGTVYMLVNLNSNAKVGQIENWIFIPILISTLGMSWGNTDAQNQSISFKQGEGRPLRYAVPRTA